MRSLVFSMLSLLSFAAFASTQTVSTQFDVQNTQQPLGITGVSNSPSTNNVRSTLGFYTDKIGKGFLLNSKMIVDNPDYSSSLVRDNQNVASPLSLEKKQEYQADIKLGWQKNTSAISLGYFGHLSTSPYEAKGTSVEFYESFYEKTTILGFEASYIDQKRPTDYFIDRDLVLKKRPTAVHGSEFAASVEQVLSERWKFLTRLTTAKKNEECPRNYGLEGRLAFAAAPRTYSLLKLSYFGEDQREPLLNERGYFSAFVSQVEVTYEPLYDFLVSLSYGLSVERENEVRSATLTQVAVDQFGFGFKYSFKDLTVNLQAAVSSSNALTSSHKVSGGLTWNL